MCIIYKIECGYKGALFTKLSVVTTSSNGHGESSSNFANDTSGMSGEKNLSKKSFGELSKIVVGLAETNKNQKLKIQELEKKQQEMNDCLRAQERYTSKDCVII